MLAPEILTKLMAWAKEDPKAEGHNYLLQQLNQWDRIKDTPEGAISKSLADFYGNAQQFVELVTTNRLLLEKDIDGHWLAYLVTEIAQHKYRREDGEKIPAKVELKLSYVKADKVEKRSVIFYQTHLEQGTGKNKTYLPIRQVIEERGYYAATPEIVKELGELNETFAVIQSEVGAQFLAEGHGRTIDLSGERNYYWGSSEKYLPMLREGSPAVVLVDDTSIEDEKDRDKSAARRYWSWYDEDDEAKDSTDYEELTIPVHPLVTVFDLQEHRHFTVHLSNLQPYGYDASLRNKLVLPEGHLELVDLLIGDGSSEVMEDIVRGKSGGIIVLASGVPGTGKTLTAEIYSETVKKPLYSVQCSQLGLNPDQLEKNLIRTLARAARWNAILLLDEADVYIRERGTDYVANAMVGTFLRLLERFKGILWMTTNMDNTDDAILSRCSVHLRYKRPETEEAKRLWDVIGRNYLGKELTAPVRAAILTKYPHLTGRNIKQLCKLGSLLKQRKGEEFTVQVIDRLSAFVDLDAKETRRASAELKA